MKKSSNFFEVTNNQTNKTIIVDSDKNFQSLQDTLDGVTAEKMLAKVTKEENPQRKKTMMLYAKRRKELEDQGLLSK